MRLTGSILVCSALLLIPLLPSCKSTSRARALIEQHKCLDCHMLKGKGGSTAPNLTTVGSRRDRVYIYQQIKAPRSHNPNSDMPSFGDRMSEQDMNDLTDYLSGLK